MGDVEKLLYCNFCGKHQREVMALIAGPDCYICDECVDLCVGIISAKHPEKRNAQRDALVKIIEMNRQQAEDQYGDANKAESWNCVMIARQGLKGGKSCE